MSKKTEEVAEGITQRIPDEEPPEDKHPSLVAVIPAGGLGGQMIPVTSGMPKALLPFNNKPLLVKILQKLDPSIFKTAIIFCNEWHNMIASYVKAFKSEIAIKCECEKTDKLPPQYLKELLGKGKLSDPFLFHYCDIWIEDKVDWEWIFDTYKRIKHNRQITALVFGSRCYDYSVGIMSLDRHHRVMEFKQKPEDIIHGYANCAIALLSTEFVQDYINSDEVDIYDKEAAFQRALGDKKVFGCEVGDWYHFQQIRDWLRAQKKYYDHIPF